MSEVKTKAAECRKAAARLAYTSTQVKDKALIKMAEYLEENEKDILAANKIDLENLAKKPGYTKAFHDRLELNPARIKDMADGLRDIQNLMDPIGEVITMWKRPNELQIGQVRVPLGVVGIIYEARPNVTVDAAALCVKAGNAVILRGSSEAIESNKKLVEILKKACIETGLPSGTINLIEDTDRAAARELMQMNGYVDVLIPRGSGGLIKSVIENATVPVIETGEGNCHTYVDKETDLDMAVSIAFNAKTHRPGVCNAMETLLVHSDIANDYLPKVSKLLEDAGVEIRACSKTREIIPQGVLAEEKDWATEYLDMILAVKVVESIDEAIEHINKYGTKHSEAIVTTSYSRSRKFLNQVDAAAVYVNASTRFTDGAVFGLGGEMGISTQKLHTRGPMGLKALTSIKYVIYGDGQVR
ncbi:glutamate-5-semialdehyde dehydrogenase [Candidatus Contubernalis alkaliaceticus]|uniref:glutamate-5-semialdehyde dehydrogenase n=1 Tax=Candidatus Contubernalis alkaliaceticus TaxID=338645 RepID=UPI001F4C4160|nr:glutamate-5-semialdehyde dehydrogenase [Candidatus Contubernalis alkalaceticus]UNC92395.1 glutamate-5-semialdehyde dehydrogenase [Candidatus Contubernalis alkalaceticus]